MTLQVRQISVSGSTWCLPREREKSPTGNLILDGFNKELEELNPIEILKFEEWHSIGEGGTDIAHFRASVLLNRKVY